MKSKRERVNIKIANCERTERVSTSVVSYFYFQAIVGKHLRVGSLAELKIGGREIEKSLFLCLFFVIAGDYKKTSKKGELEMNIYVYAGFTYLLTAAIALLMIGAVVLLNKLMGNNDANEGEIN